jgi:hypothetical protein
MFTTIHKGTSIHAVSETRKNGTRVMIVRADAAKIPASGKRSRGAGFTMCTPLCMAWFAKGATVDGDAMARVATASLERFSGAGSAVAADVADIAACRAAFA